MYCQNSDIENHLNNEILLLLTDDDKNGIVDSDIIEAAIVSAESVINAFLENSFSVPFSPVPDFIKNLTIDIAVAELYSRHPEVKSETVRKKYLDAIRILSQLAKGEINLSDDFPRLNKNITQTSSEDVEKLFSRNTLKPF